MGNTLKFIIAFSLFFLVLFFHLSCSTTEPPDNPEPALKLELEDVSCTEAWITLTTANLQLPTTITLKQNEETIETINLSTNDSLLYIDSLLPNLTYTFKATCHSGLSGISSNELSVTTMDTTSHNFIWQTWTFGEHSSSVLYDVAIIDENNIWAVGEIYMNDSLGNPDPNAYNAIHWNGNDWIPKKINVLFRGNIITPPLEGVFAFSSTDIWFVGSLPIHGDGTNWTMYDLRTTVDPNLSLSKAWGSSSDDIYFVGRAGSIAHYNGSSWTKIESGTSLPIQSIWGSTNDNGEEEIICIASDRVLNNGNKILQIVNNSVKELNNQNLPWSLSSIWFKSGIKYYIVGDGIYTNWSTIKDWNKEEIPPLLYKHTIFGIAINDIIVAGAYGLILHYNGYRWNHLMGDLSNYSNHLSVKFVDGTMVVVGMNLGIQGYQSKIIMGKRN